MLSLSTAPQGELRAFSTSPEVPAHGTLHQRRPAAQPRSHRSSRLHSCRPSCCHPLPTRVGQRDQSSVSFVSPNRMQTVLRSGATPWENRYSRTPPALLLETRPVPLAAAVRARRAVVRAPFSSVWWLPAVLHPRRQQVHSGRHRLHADLGKAASGPISFRSTGMRSTTTLRTTCSTCCTGLLTRSILVRHPRTRLDWTVTECAQAAAQANVPGNYIGTRRRHVLAHGLRRQLSLELLQRSEIAVGRSRRERCFESRRETQATLACETCANESD